jgi:RNA polymerase sigma-70 factor (sigma-E family)
MQTGTAHTPGPVGATGWEVGMDRAAGPYAGQGSRLPSEDPRTWDADTAVTVLHSAHYRSLVRTAALLMRRSDQAEEIVQDAFVGLHRRWARLRDPDKALAYLRQSTVNGARSALRRAATASRKEPLLRDAGSVPDPAAALVERDAVLGALSGLPDRQREVLVLRYYGGLSEAEIAEATGITRGTVKSTASRALDAVGRVMNPRAGL